MATEYNATRPNRRPPPDREDIDEHSSDESPSDDEIEHDINNSDIINRVIRQTGPRDYDGVIRQATGRRDYDRAPMWVRATHTMRDIIVNHPAETAVAAGLGNVLFQYLRDCHFSDNWQSCGR